MRTPYRLAIVSTHPIQYQSPWFRGLAAHPDVKLHVYYCHKATPEEQARAGFGVAFGWDVPLLEGYPHTFLRNVANPAGHGRFAGFDTPGDRGHHPPPGVRRRPREWLALQKRLAGNLGLLEIGSQGPSARRFSSCTLLVVPLKKLAKSLAYRRFIPRFDACLAVGQWSREYFLYYGACPERIFFVPHAADNQRIAAECHQWEPTRCQLRSRWGLDEKNVVFAFAGKFIEKKRPMDFVRAIDQAGRQCAAVQGLMVGDGPLRAGCEDFVRAHRSPICFTGFLNQSQIVAAYAASDLLVLPSDGGETWGLVVNEAMACGRPCIVSDQVGCGPDLIEVGRTGAIFPLGDVDALAALMTGLTRDPSHLAFMSTQARCRIQKHSIQAAVEGVLRCMAAITGSRTLVCNC